MKGLVQTKMDMMADILRRLAQLETQVKGAKEYEATVLDNDDPLKLNRVKAACPPIWGAYASPWIINKTETGGNGVGSVFTPRIGDTISVRLRDGNADAPEWSHGHRSDESPPPEEFADPKVNGIKTDSGITMTYNDNEGSWSVEDASGNKVYIDGAGNVHIYGTKVFVHAPTDLNSDAAVYGVVTGGPAHICPYNGKPHQCSQTVKAAE